MAEIALQTVNKQHMRNLRPIIFSHSPSLASIHHHDSVIRNHMQLTVAKKVLNESAFAQFVTITACATGDDDSMVWRGEAVHLLVY